VFHGGGGFKHSEVYNMPIWMRRFHISKINEHNKKQNEEIEKAQKGTSPASNRPTGPNINPSSTYNF
jgi:isopentenyl phosphate kinase